MKYSVFHFLLFAAAIGVAAEAGKNHPNPPASDLGGRNTLTKQVSNIVGESGAPIVPRRNFIDEYILGRMEKDHIPHAGLCTDTEFLRRISLDLTGRLPGTRRHPQIHRGQGPWKTRQTH
jgi:hypothetical protein